MEAGLQLESRATRTAWFSMLSSLVLVVIKLVSGVLGNSFALIADGVESATDVLSTLLVVIGLRYARRPPDENHPYGHGKVEPLVTFAVVAVLLLSAGTIAYRAVVNMGVPQRIPEAWTLVVIIMVIIWKEYSYRRVLREAERLSSSSLKADAWHHRSDAISSVLALLGVGVAVLLGERFAKADELAALLAAGFICYNSFLIFRPALGEVMDEHVYPDVEEDVRRLAYSIKGMKATEKCRVRKLGMRYHVDLHIQVDGKMSVEEGHQLAHEVKDKIREGLPQVADVHIHVEPFEFSPH